MSDETTVAVPTIDELMTAAKVAAAKHKAAFDQRRDMEHELTALATRVEELRVASGKAFAALQDALATLQSGGV